MRTPRGRGPERRWPTGRAEVDLFSFWEKDLATGSSPCLDAELNSQMAAQPHVAASAAGGSLRPLWWSVGIAVLVVLLAVLA